MDSKVLIMYALFMVAFYFLFIRPRSTQAKKIQQMQGSLQVGDQITTHGGIVGRITAIVEDEIEVLTGENDTAIRLKRWAVRDNGNVSNDVSGEKKSTD